MCKSLHRMTEDVYSSRVDSILKIIWRELAETWNNGLRTKLEMYRLVFQRIPTTLIWDAISSWIKGFSMSPVGTKKKRVKGEKKKKRLSCWFQCPWPRPVHPKLQKQPQQTSTPDRRLAGQVMPEWGPLFGATQTFASPCPRAIRACRDGHRAFCFACSKQLAAKWQANEDNPLQALISSQSADDSSKPKTLTGGRGGSLGPFYC